MQILQRIHRRFFYDPYRTVAKSRNIQMGRSKLGPSFDVRFDVPREGIALEIGNDCILHNSFVFESVEGRIAVGDGVLINGGTSLISRSSIEVGNSVTISWGCMIYDHNGHSRSYLDRIADHELGLRDFPGNGLASKDWSHVNAAPIRICDYAWIGFDAVVLKGVTIGEGSIVGARSVVRRDIPPWTIAFGNPAEVVGEIPAELRKR